MDSNRKNKSRGTPTEMNMPRRTAIGAALAGMAACWTAKTRSGAHAADKMTREQAQYQDHPQGIFSCALCSLFEPPSSCKVVEGEVSKDGWCRAFAMAD